MDGFCQEPRCGNAGKRGVERTVETGTSSRQNKRTRNRKTINKRRRCQTTTVAAGLVRLQLQLQWQLQTRRADCGFDPKSGRLASRTT